MLLRDRSSSPVSPCLPRLRGSSVTTSSGRKSLWIGRSSPRACSGVNGRRKASHGSPLLVEGDRADRSDAVVIVDAPIEQRIERLEARGVASEDARSRIRAQASSQERRAVASIWIDNEGSAAELEEVAGLVYERWLTPDVPIVD